MHLLDSLVSQLHSQFVGGGLVLLLTGSLLALLRAMPGKVLAWIKRRITVEVEILNSDPLFDYVTRWLNDQPYSRRSRRLTATTHDEGESTGKEPGGQEKKALRVLLVPAPGTHVFIYERNLLWFERYRENASGSGPGTNNTLPTLRKHETYRITILGKNQKVLRDLLEEIRRLGAKPADAICLFTATFGYWNSSGLIRPRKLESVILPSGLAELVTADVRDFLGSGDWYRSIGIPWHRGYLFYGIPGSGKTSLVTALAGEFGRDLYLLNIGCSGMDDERLGTLMGAVRTGSIVVMEDVDCTFPGREAIHDGQRHVTLSGLLNCLDGVQSREGCMIFMTTNFRTKLDAALTRPGRVDMAVEFGPATDEQMERLRVRIAPHLAAVPADCKGRSMAEVQQSLLKRSVKTCAVNA